MTSEVLKLRVQTSDGQESFAYLDWNMISGLPELLLPNVQQLAWDMLPDAGEIQASYIDDEGDRCTLTEGTAGDALQFTKPCEEEGEKVLEVTVRGVREEAPCADVEAPFATGVAEEKRDSSSEVASSSIERTTHVALEGGATSSDEFTVGDRVLRKGEEAVIKTIDRTLEPPSFVICMDSDGREIGTEGHLLQKQSVCSEFEANDAELAELGLSVRGRALSEALSAPRVEVMGPPATSDEATTEAAPTQHRFARHEVSPFIIKTPSGHLNELEAEAAPVQHRFARHKAEDVQKHREQSELYLKQAEEAKLEAEAARLEAWNAQQKSSMLQTEMEEIKVSQARQLLLIEQLDAECAKVAEAKQKLSNVRMQIEEFKMQVAEANQRAADAKAEAVHAKAEAAEAKEMAADADQRAEDAKSEAVHAKDEAAEANSKAADAEKMVKEANDRLADALTQLEVAQQRASHAEDKMKDAWLLSKDAEANAAEAKQRASDAEAKEASAQENAAASIDQAKLEADEARSSASQAHAELHKKEVMIDGLHAELKVKTAVCDQLTAKVHQHIESCNKLKMELANAKKQAVTKQTSASAVVVASHPLLFGIEAEEEPSARCDATSRSASTLAKLGARQAFCIGRVRLAAGGIEPATGRPLAAVPASVMVTVTNNGSVEWPATTVITSISDDSLGVPVVPLGALPAGSSKSVEMDLLVPSKPEATTAQYLWAVMDARTSALLGTVLIFEAVWNSP